MKIRDFTQLDQDTCRRIHVSSLKTEGFEPKVIAGDFDDNIFHKYISTGGSFKVVEIESKIIAFGGILKCDSTTFEVMRMRVLSEFQRTGVGSVLLQTLEKSAFKLGCKLLKLDTINIQAKKFYHSHGYTLTKEEPEGTYTCFYFEKAL